MAKRKRRNVPVRRTVEKEKSGFLKYLLGVLFLVIASGAFYYFFIFQNDEPEPKQTTETVEVPEERVIKIEVLNGCGVPKLARQCEEFLRTKGFDVVNTDNAAGFDYLETIVIARDTVLSYAEKVAEALFIKENVIQQINRDLLIDVTVILGRDYKKLAFISQKGEGSL